MKIYTKGGDHGETSLIGGRRVKKNDPKVEAYGNVDELIAIIAIIRASIEDKNFISLFREIQSNLMQVAAHFAADPSSAHRLGDFNTQAISQLEEQIDSITETLPQQTAFILPAGPLPSAYSHLARTVCRRAERSAVSLEFEERLVAPIKYLNRLSDFLFVFGRLIAFKSGIGDDFWHG